MRTLTEIFTPGAPTLPEGLRTLVVSPEREVEPGMTVRAHFTFRNQGGAVASGVRVRMNVPDGLVYLVGTARLDGVELPEEQGSCPLLSRNGAHIGDVAPGEERRVDIAYIVAGAIENATAIELQAAVAAFEIAPVGSNVVRLVVRSRPVLDNSLTNIAIEARHEARPGAEAVVTLRLHNAGESSAHDVVIVTPIPAHATYVANSARLNGRELEPELRVPFDRAYAPIIATALQANATAVLTYRVRTNEFLENGTVIVARATVASQETPAFDLPPASLTISSAPRFDDDRTQLTVDPASEVQPGERVTVRLVVANCGTTATQSSKATLNLPDGLLFVRGSGRLDGRPLRDRRKELGAFDLGRIDAGACVELAADATVQTPQLDGHVLPITVRLDWDESERTFERSLTVRSQPYLNPRRSRIERRGANTVRPGETIEAAIVLQNEGPAAATDCVLELQTDPALEAIELFEKTEKVNLEDRTAELDRIEPYSGRRFILRARVRSPYADAAPLEVSASLHSLELGEAQLGSASYRVDSHPLFSTERSTIALTSDEVLRPNQLADVYVRLVNQGTDVAHDVSLRLFISPEARVESVDGVTRKKTSLIFGEIAPGASVEARIVLRLLRSVARDYPVRIDAVLTAAGVVPVQLRPLTITTAAEPDFSVGVLRCEPADLADAGETVRYIFHVRNSGDGTARRVQVTVEPSDALIYVPNSTSVNGVAVRDIGAASPLFSGQGIVLNDAEPGVEATISWREVIHTGLPAGESIVRIAHVRYDNERHDEFSSAELKVRAAPVFANNIPGLPFGLDGIVGPPSGAATRALPDAGDGFVQLPPATPVSQETYWLADGGAERALEESVAGAQLRNVELRPNGSGAEELQTAEDGTVAIATVFRPERLDKTLRFLREAQFGGLISHLFAIRAFFPTFVAGSSALQAALEDERMQLRDALDRLFIKLRLPHYLVAPRDVENVPMRTALLTVFDRLEERVPASGALAREGVVFSGSIDPAEAGQVRNQIVPAELGTAALWNGLAFFIPDGPLPLRSYREALLEDLERLAGLSPNEFCNALREPALRLDAAFEEVLSGLAAAV
jgi:uncharacterized repeat protein (TIGR01451 family)